MQSSVVCLHNFTVMPNVQKNLYSKNLDPKSCGIKDKQWLLSWTGTREMVSLKMALPKKCLSIFFINFYNCPLFFIITWVCVLFLCKHRLHIAAAKKMQKKGAVVFTICNEHSAQSKFIILEAYHSNLGKADLCFICI